MLLKKSGNVDILSIPQGEKSPKSKTRPNGNFFIRESPILSALYCQVKLKESKNHLRQTWGCCHNKKVARYYITPLQKFPHRNFPQIQY